MLGNFPQAYSHVGVINCALNLSRQAGPADDRAEPQPAVDAGRHCQTGRGPKATSAARIHLVLERRRSATKKSK
jgi:hypothetical protein